ncbi:MAG: hypothetical protein ACLR4Z_01800 [Butyricicoccaceae bacterium]
MRANVDRTAVDAPRRPRCPKGLARTAPGCTSCDGAGPPDSASPALTAQLAERRP